MKFLSAQLSHFVADARLRANLRSLAKYVLFLAAMVAVYTVAFQLIMAHVEGVEHSWVTGFYWTLTVMSTLGFGDITFVSDVGRVFSVVVLLSGILMLLIVLPFAFIRYFYAPWLEAHLRSRAPRSLAAETSGHVLLCGYDPIARELIERLRLLRIPHHILSADPAAAAELYTEGLPVVAADPESPGTWKAVRVEQARAVVAVCSDARNTNIALTVRERAPDTMIVAIAESEDSIDILELAGASEVLALKQRLGEHLANRVNAGHAEAHVIGRFEDLVIAEFPVQNTPLVGRTIRQTRLREVIGVNIVGVWERGLFEPARPDRVLTDACVPVVIGTPAQVEELDTVLVIYDTNYKPTIVIGGGKVGCAAARTLKRREVAVHIVEHDPALAPSLLEQCDRLVVGNAADRSVLDEAGIAEAPAVLLTTNDDSINIYLTVYCRRLNPALRIVSRVTDAKNIPAMHRAGADFVLSDASLAAELMASSIQGRELMMLGAGVDLFHIEVPGAIAGKPLAEAGIGERTGLNVIAVRQGDRTTANPPPALPLPAGGELLMLGTPEQERKFMRLFF